MKNKVEIVQVKNPNDFKKFIEIYGESAQLSEEWIQKFQKDVLVANSIITILLALVDGKSIWFMILIDWYSSTLLQKTIYLEEFYIKKDLRSMSYWSVFFEYLKEYSRENDIIRIEWSTHRDNKWAQKFYEKYEVDNNWLYYKLKL